VLKANSCLVLEPELRGRRYKKNWTVIEVNIAYNNWPIREFQHGLCISLRILGVATVGKLANLGMFVEISGTLWAFASYSALKML
jgi:hypothetical protein